MKNFRLVIFVLCAITWFSCANSQKKYPNLSIIGIWNDLLQNKTYSNYNKILVGKYNLEYSKENIYSNSNENIIANIYTGGILNNDPINKWTISVHGDSVIFVSVVMKIKENQETIDAWKDVKDNINTFGCEQKQISKNQIVWKVKRDKVIIGEISVRLVSTKKELAIFFRRKNDIKNGAPIEESKLFRP